MFGQASSIEMLVPWVPELTTIAGKPIVYYELHIGNSTGDTLDLKKLDLMDAKNGETIASIKSDLETRPGGDVVPIGSQSILSPGESRVLYVEVVLESVNPGTRIIHRLGLEILSGKERKVSSTEGAAFTLSGKKPLVLGQPLSAGPWAAIYEPSWERGHRRVIYTVENKKRIPGRFAIDFIKLDDQGKFANGTDNEIKNWYGYSADVFAVSDGIVASTRIDFSESQTLAGHPDYSADEATGNYIAIAIGKDQFVFYEHLKPGSIRVEPGQKVKKGDVIASLGFTGQSTGPHLHFHVADKNSPLGAEGIPFVFEHFEMLGSYPDISKLGAERWTTENPNHIRKERPAPNAVIQFRR